MSCTVGAQPDGVTRRSAVSTSRLAGYRSKLASARIAAWICQSVSTSARDPVTSAARRDDEQSPAPPQAETLGDRACLPSARSPGFRTCLPGDAFPATPPWIDTTLDTGVLRPSSGVILDDAPVRSADVGQLARNVRTLSRDVVALRVDIEHYRTELREVIDRFLDEQEAAQRVLDEPVRTGNEGPEREQ